MGIYTLQVRRRICLKSATKNSQSDEAVTEHLHIHFTSNEPGNVFLSKIRIFH